MSLPRNPTWPSRVKAKAHQLRHVCDRLEQYDKEWLELIESLPPVERTADEQYYGLVAVSSVTRIGLLESLEKGRSLIADLEAGAIEEESLARARITEAELNRTVAPTADAVSIAPREGRIKLPVLELGNFSGKREDYWAFKAMFGAAVDTNTELQPFQKLQYLLRAVDGGSAARLLAGLAITDPNYEVARKLLDCEYGDEREQVRDLHSRLSKLKAPRTFPQLRDFQAELEATCLQLQTMGYGTDTDVRLLDDMESKLPRYALGKILQVRDDKLERDPTHATWSMKDFRRVLWEVVRREDIVRRCTAEQPTTDMRKAQTSRRPGASIHAALADEDTDVELEPELEAARESKPAVAPAAADTEEKVNFIRSDKPKCIFGCTKGQAEKEPHWSSRCPNYPTPAQRRRRLAELKLCWKCFRPAHTARDCTARVKCQKCGAADHKRPLCPELEVKEVIEQVKVEVSQAMIAEPPNSPPESEDEEGVAAFSTRASAPPASTRVLLMCVRVRVINPRNVGQQKELLAFLDSGATTGFITVKAARDLALQMGSPVTLNIDRFNDSKSDATQSHRVEAGLRRKNGEMLTVGLYTNTSITQQMVSGRISPSELARLRRPGELPVAEHGTPDLLLGTDLWHRPLKVRWREELPSGFSVYDTAIGLALHGQGQVANPATACATVVVGMMRGTVSYSKTNELDEETRNYFSMEGIGLKDDAKELNEKRAEDIFRQTFRRHEDGRPETGLPWVYPPQHPPTNYELAHAWLVRGWKKLSANPSHLAEYHRPWQKALEGGVLRPVDEAAAPAGPIHYLVHFAVPKKDGSPRLVLAANMKRRQCDKSLNECLLKGPVLLQDLTGLLLRSTLKPIMITADIEGAFHQVGIRKEDQDSLRCLWLADPTKPPSPDNVRVYAFTRAVMGVAPSPSILAMILRQAVEELSGDEAELGRRLARNLYVDNVFLMGNSEEALAEDAKRACDIFARSKMNLREFLSNRSSTIQALPEAKRLPMKETKVLGIWWDPETDVYSVRPPPALQQAAPPTRRQMLSTIAKVFDPLGWASPVLLPAKLLLQQAAMAEKKWDDPIVGDMAEKWNECIGFWNATISRPRYCNIEGKLRLNIFTGASNRAMGVAAYLSGESRAALIMSKCRVKLSNWKSATGGTDTFSPMLELAAIELGTRVMKFLQRELDCITDGCTIWTDSEVAIRWLRSGRPKPAFVEGRVHKIRQFAELEVRHVPGEWNPANLATRGATAETLQASELWWNGPAWLSQPKLWPVTDMVYRPGVINNDPTPIMVVPKAEPDPQLLDYERFGTWRKLVRTLAYAIRFAQLVRKVQPEGKELSLAELVRSKGCILRDAQKQDSSRDKAHLPWCDDDGLWRINGRLDEAPLPPDARTPIILPREHRVTTLIILDTHHQLQHANVQTTLVELRQWYWYPAPRQTTKSVLRKCPTCRRLRGPPFGVLLTCLSVRAVNLKLAIDGTARTFLLALRRHIARYGVPATLVLDNGSNFLLGRRAVELVETHRDKRRAPVEGEPILRFCANHSIRWQVNTPLAPWRGGVFERMVALTRESSQAMVTRSRPSIDAYETLLAEAATIVNSRPITYLTEDTKDPLPLRPLDFLRPLGATAGRSIGGIGDENPVHGTATTPERLQDMWSGLNARLNRFWDRWAGEYLTGLMDKGTKKTLLGYDRKPVVGELVLVGGDKMLKRGDWPLARITELLPSRDGFGEGLLSH